MLPPQWHYVCTTRKPGHTDRSILEVTTVSRISAFAPLCAPLPRAATATTTDTKHRLRLPSRLLARPASVGITAHLNQRRYHLEGRSLSEASSGLGPASRRLSNKALARSTIAYPLDQVFVLATVFYKITSPPRPAPHQYFVTLTQRILPHTLHP